MSCLTNSRFTALPVVFLALYNKRDLLNEAIRLALLVPFRWESQFRRRSIATLQMPPVQLDVLLDSHAMMNFVVPYMS